MTERLIEKLDRLAAEAGIKEVTPELRQFALLVRQDVVGQWPQRTWVGLTDEDKKEYVAQDFGGNRLDAMDWAEKRLKEKNNA